jgi:hypothetical protein
MQVGFILVILYAMKFWESLGYQICVGGNFGRELQKLVSFER